MKPQAPDIFQYTNENYTELLENYKTKISPKVKNKDLDFVNYQDVIISFKEADLYLLNSKKLIPKNMPNLIIAYCENYAKKSVSNWICQFFGIEVEDVGQLKVTFIVRNEFKNSNYTHIVAFVKYKNSWFLFIYNRQMNSTQISCPNQILSQEVSNLVVKLLQQEWNIKPNQVIQAKSGGGGIEENELKILLWVFCYTSINAKLHDLNQNEINSSKNMNLLDWLMLKLGRQVPPVEQSTVKWTDRPLQVTTSRKSLKDNDQNSYSHILDEISSLNILQQEEEFTGRNGPSKNEDKVTHQDTPRIQHKKYGERQFKQQQKDEIDILIENMKNDILAKIKEQKPQGNAPFLKQNLSKYNVSLEESQNDQHLVNIPIQELNNLLQDYSKQMPEDKLIQKQFKEQLRQIEEQNAMKFLSQYNPQEYHRIVNSKMQMIKEQIFQGLGLESNSLKSSTPNINSQFNLGYEKTQTKNYQSQIIQFNQRVNNQYKQFNQRGSDEMLKNKPINEKQFVVSRYNRYITENDLGNLKNNGMLNPTMLDFFIKYLQEKQEFMVKFNVDKQKQVFFLTSVNGTCDYESSKNFTSPYTGKNNTIFERFDVAIIPIMLNPNNFKVVFINFPTRTLKLVDTFENNQDKELNRQERAEILNNPILQSIVKFLEFEYNNKFMRNFDLLKWKFEKVEGIGAQSQSPLCTAYIIYYVSRKFSLPFDVQNKLAVFSQDLVKLFQFIGVTKNRKNELEAKIKDLPL